MAPEVLDDALYDERADLWSVGCILYETLFGKPPMKTQHLMQLCKWLRNPEIDWPPQMEPNCESFLKGLLRKDPKTRLTWNEILDHPYVKDHLLILEHDNKMARPLTQALTSSQQLQKDKQRNEIILHRSKKMIAEAMSKCQKAEPKQAEKQNQQSKKSRKNVIGDNESLSSEDSNNAIIQTDLETDIEITVPSKRATLKEAKPMVLPQPIQHTDAVDNLNFVIQRFESNFIVPDTDTANQLPEDPNTNLNFKIGTMAENLQQIHLEDELKLAAIKAKKLTTTPPKPACDENQQIGESSTKLLPQDSKASKKDLEKRKLSQNLDNFSIRLGNSLTINNESSSKDCDKDDSREKCVR